MVNGLGIRMSSIGGEFVWGYFKHIRSEQWLGSVGWGVGW